jgi:hypothetical protein
VGRVNVDVLREAPRLAEDALAQCRSILEQQRAGIGATFPAREARLVEQPEDVIRDDLLVGNVGPDLPSRGILANYLSRAPDLFAD